MHTGVGDTRPSHAKKWVAVFKRVFHVLVGTSSVIPYPDVPDGAPGAQRASAAHVRNAPKSQPGKPHGSGSPQSKR
jgi:hypothetical protein